MTILDFVVVKLIFFCGAGQAQGPTRRGMDLFEQATGFYAVFIGGGALEVSLEELGL